jgi:hypothetical protein
MWEFRSHKAKLIPHNIKTQAWPANVKPSEIIVSLRIELELLPLFQCIHARLPYLTRNTNQVSVSFEGQ